MTSNFFWMYSWSSDSEDETATLNSTKSLSNEFCSKLRSLCFFFLNCSTDALKVFIISSMFSSLFLPRVSNCWIVPNNSISFETLLQNRSNFPKIWFSENSNCFPFGMFISFSLVISYWVWYDMFSSMHTWEMELAYQEGISRGSIACRPKFLRQVLLLCSK